ncbi:MAG: sugar-transfer associated ATP-grasp domain-containing protein [Stellaceae bacterium]
MRDSSATASSVDVVRPRAPRARLRQVAARKGVSYVHLLAAWMALWLRRGLSIEEYLGLELFDGDRYAAADKSAFVGIKGARRILLRANYRFDLYGLVDNKIACDFLLAAHGLPIMPTVALYRDATGLAWPFLLRSEAELRAFLSSGERYPLFGKPLGGRQSLGAASFDRYDGARDALVTFGGRNVALDAFVREVKTHYPSGYLLQKRVSPHAAVRALCGDRLATVRVLTAMTRQGPQILRAGWKIPAGINAADNFWRVGNLLAQLDIASGRVLRAVRATRDSFEEITHHPDTGASLIGAAVPNWRQILDHAREGARVLADLPLLGWDIAAVDAGAVIVEVNHIPDFRLHQIADRRGILDPAMVAFLRERKPHAAAWRRSMAARG